MITNTIATIAYVLTAFATVFSVSRFLVRRLKHESFKADDYVVQFAVVLYWIYTTSFYFMVRPNWSHFISAVRLCLASPLITRQLNNGANVTTPDARHMSPEEVKRGMNFTNRDLSHTNRIRSRLRF